MKSKLITFILKVLLLLKSRFLNGNHLDIRFDSILHAVDKLNATFSFITLGVRILKMGTKIHITKFIGFGLKAWAL